MVVVVETLHKEIHIHNISKFVDAFISVRIHQEGISGFLEILSAIHIERCWKDLQK